MPSSQRVFVDAIKKYCAAHGIAVDVRADGWLIVMRRGERQHFTLGYDVGLNSAIAHRIANDKSATAEALQLSGVSCVPHSFFLSPKLNQYVPPEGSWEAMLALLEQYPKGLVVKPNEGTSGKSVFRVKTKSELELAVNRVFATSASLAISPLLDIEDEVRVVLIDDVPAIVYRKERPAVLGDGKHSLFELALAFLHLKRRSTILPAMIEDLGKAELDAIVPRGELRVLNWHHNLETGATPQLLERGEMHHACVHLAIRAAQAIGIRFASIDVVRAGGDWKILEVNSGVMMEALGRLHPDLVYATYSAALDKVFK